MTNNVAQAIFGVVWFIAGILIVVQTSSWFTTLAEQITDDFFRNLYWISYVALIVVCVLLPAFSIVINAFKDADNEDLQ